MNGHTIVLVVSVGALVARIVLERCGGRPSFDSPPRRADTRSEGGDVRPGRVLLAGLFCLVPLAAFAQDQDLASPGALRRIRDALAVRGPDLRGAAAIYRVTTEQRAIDLPAPWVDRPAIARWVRPPRCLFQHEFLTDVTPEEFRASVVHPIGVPVDRVIRITAAKARGALRRSREVRARGRSEAELAQLRDPGTKASR
jgi:hypothetical protein